MGTSINQIAIDILYWQILSKEGQEGKYHNDLTLNYLYFLRFLILLARDIINNDIKGREMKTNSKSVLFILFLFPLIVFIMLRSKQEKSQQLHQTRELKADWNYKLRLDSEHFALFTTSSKSVAESVLEVAENVYKTFCSEFGDTGMIIPSKTKIYLFEKKNDYRDYMKSKGVIIEKGPNLLPHYSSHSDATYLIHLGKSKEYLYQNVAHEITHSLSPSLLKSLYNSGAWVIEGIAYYVGLSLNWKKKQVVPGEIHQTKNSQMVAIVMGMLKLKKLIPLKKFINMREYALEIITAQFQAFSLFHFLQHAEGSKYKAGFHRYLAEISAGQSGDAEVLEKYVGKISEIEPNYFEYIKKLRPDTNLKMR